MKKQLILAVACLVASLAQAAPYLPEQLRLRVTVQPSSDVGIVGSTMYNPRFFDGKIYANQINIPCFGRYASGSSTPEVVVNNSANLDLEHRMVAPFRGAQSSTYLIGSSAAGGVTTTFTRYNFDGTSPTSVDTPDSLKADAFDWVDDNTLIYAAENYGDYRYSGSAYQNGYRDGLYTGANDARRGQSYDPGRSHFFQNGAYGYDVAFGARGVYQQAYRDGFLRGYQDGFANWRRYFSNGSFHP